MSSLLERAMWTSTQALLWSKGRRWRHPAGCVATKNPTMAALSFSPFLLRANTDSMRTAPGSCGGAATDLVPVLLRSTISVLLLPVQMRNWLLVASCLLVQARNFLILLPSAGGAS